MMTVMVPDMLEPTEELRALSVLVARDCITSAIWSWRAYESGGFPRTLPSAAFAKDNIGEFGGQSFSHYNFFPQHSTPPVTLGRWCHR